MTACFDAASHWLEESLACAAEEAAGDNLARWLRFLGVADGEWLELQALGIRTNWGERARFAHADSTALAVELVEQAERFGAAGVFCIANRLNDAVVTRRQPRRWHEAIKGASTSDRDIVARRVLFIDVDAKRPSQTSASDEEMGRTAPVAIAIHERLASILGGDSALGYGHSGNGRQVFAALAGLPESEDLHRTIKGIVSALAILHSADGVDVDPTVTDPKRLMPAFGSTKRKGATGIAERPHRRTAFVCAERPEALSREKLEVLFTELRAALDDDGRQAVDRAMGIRPNLRLVTPAAAIATDNPWTRANAVPIADVAAWLDILDGESPRCPGCGNTQGVDFVANGLKCLHKTCADKGLPGKPGFRTAVDLVAEARGIEPREALNLLAQRFGFQGLDATQAKPKSPRRSRSESVQGRWRQSGNAAVAEDVAPDATPDGRPVLVVTTEEHEAIDRAIEALVTGAAPIYQRGGALARVIRDESPLAGIVRAKGAPRISPVPLPRLRELLAQSVLFRERKKKDGDIVDVPCHPPEWCVKGVDARGEWPGIRHLEAIVEVPVIRPDGTVLQDPGYDPSTGLLYAPACQYPHVPTVPSREDAQHAIETLLETVCDFPFESPAHRSTWLAAVLSPFARYAYRGPTPLFLVDANVRGAGKSKLVDVIGEIVSGRPTERMSQAEDEAEERKRITSILMAGYPLVLLDNITRPLGSGALDAALTGEQWADRALGSNTSVSLPLLTVWYATGNNVQLVADTTRRVAHIRLLSPEENPENRTAFRHANLTEWVREHRAKLAVAAATVLRAYYAGGAPDMGLKAWGSFEGWSRVVRQALVWASQADPADAREELEQAADGERSAALALLEGLEELQRVHGALGASEIMEHLDSAPSDFDTLRKAIAELIPSPTGRLPSAHRVGVKLRGLRGRLLGGRVLERAVSRTGIAVWRVRRPSTAAPVVPVAVDVTPVPPTPTPFVDDQEEIWRPV